MSNSELLRTIVTTPVHEYAHPESENQVTLLGVTHFAQPEYYEAVQDTIADREADGAIVHYEGVREPHFLDVAATPRSVLAKAERLKDAVQTLYSWFDRSSLVMQLDALTYDADWENHDANYLDVAERMSSFTTRRLNTVIGLLDRVVHNMDATAHRKFMLSAVKAMDGTMSNNGSQKLLPRLMLGDIQGPIVNYRNDIALGALDRHTTYDPESNLVLLWGALHLPGLGDGLVERGYEKVDEQQIQAIDASRM